MLLWSSRNLLWIEKPLPDFPLTWGWIGSAWIFILLGAHIFTIFTHNKKQYGVMMMSINHTEKKQLFPQNAGLMTKNAIFFKKGLNSLYQYLWSYFSMLQMNQSYLHTCNNFQGNMCSHGSAYQYSTIFSDHTRIHTHKVWWDPSQHLSLILFN